MNYEWQEISGFFIYATTCEVTRADKEVRQKGEVAGRVTCENGIYTGNTYMTGRFAEFISLEDAKKAVERRVKKIDTDLPYCD